MKTKRLLDFTVSAIALLYPSYSDALSQNPSIIYAAVQVVPRSQAPPPAPRMLEAIPAPRIQAPQPAPHIQPPQPAPHIQTPAPAPHILEAK